MKVKLFANLADLVGSREVVIDRDQSDTVEAVVDAIIAEHPALEDAVLGDDGEIADHINVLVDGRNIRHDADGLTTTVEPDAEVALFPPVSGGSVTALSGDRC